MALVEVELTEEGGRASARPHHTGYASRNINHPSAETVVASRQLAPVVEEMLNEIRADLGLEEGEEGGVNVLCARAAMSCSASAASMERRLYEIRTGKSRATKADTADALLMAGGRYIGESEILELPAGIKAARERIEINLELMGREMSRADIEEMAEDLLEFSRCCIHGPEEVVEAEAADIVAVLNGEIVLFDFKTGEQLDLLGEVA